MPHDQADRPPPGWGLAACGASRSSTASPPDEQVPPPTTRPLTLLVPDAGSLYHGVLPAGTTSDVSPESLDAYERAVGRDVAWVYLDDERIRSLADMMVQDDPGVSSAFRAALTGPAAAKVIDRPLLK